MAEGEDRPDLEDFVDSLEAKAHYDRAAMRLGANESLSLKLSNCFSCRNTGNVEMLREFDLVEFLAVFELPVQDRDS